MHISSRALKRLLCCIALASSVVGCEEPPFPSAEELNVLQGMHSMSATPPKDPTNRFADDPLAAALGTALFRDPALSGCGNVSCSSCHDADTGTFAEPTAIGCDGQRTGRNPPTVINSGYYDFYMWDGRADRLWSQAILPFLNPVEMASSPAILRARLNEAYAAQYLELFGKTPDDTSDDELLANFGKAIAAYERTLNRTDAPFDETVKRFLAAVEAGTEQQDPAFLALKTYVRTGSCAICHSGAALTDNRFHNIALKDESAGAEGATLALPETFTWKFNAAGEFSDAPTGPETNRLGNLESDFNTKHDSFVGAFRTPSLRNVELTAPYMHTGAVATLEEVIDFYDRGGDPDGTFRGTRTQTIKKLDLTPEEKAALLELLKSMTAN